MKKKYDEKEWSGIYKIINTITNKFYIGSSWYIKHRKSHHLQNLRKNKHVNKNIQDDYNIYGETSFIFEPIEYCDKKDLLEREQYYIDILKPEYNINKYANSRKEMYHSEETKDKIRKKRNLQIFTPEMHKKGALKRVGRIHSKEEKQKRINSKQIPVLQYSAKGVFIKEWESISIASINTGISMGNIINHLKEKIKNPYKFIWKHKK